MVILVLCPLGREKQGWKVLRAIGSDVLFEQLWVICSELGILPKQQLQTLRVSHLG